MLRYRLAAHFHALTEFPHVLAISGVQPIKELPPARVGQGAKYTVVIHRINIQPFGCMSRAPPGESAAVPACAPRFQRARGVPGRLAGVSIQLGTAMDGPRLRELFCKIVNFGISTPATRGR